MKTKIKRVVILELDYKSDEYEVILKLLSLGKNEMINNLKFSQEEFDISCNIHQDFHNTVSKIGG